jgi:uncharacterized membrane protein
MFFRFCRPFFPILGVKKSTIWIELELHFTQIFVVLLFISFAVTKLEEEVPWLKIRFIPSGVLANSIQFCEVLETISLLMKVILEEITRGSSRVPGIEVESG